MIANLFGLSEAGTVAIVVAIVGAAGVIIPAGINGFVQVSKLNRKVDDLHSAMATNHGKRPGEYLELVADIARDTGAMAATLDDHSNQDERRFADLTAQIQALGDKASRTS